MRASPNKITNSPERLLTAKELASRWGLAQSTVSRQISDRKLIPDFITARGQSLFRQARVNDRRAQS